MSRKDVFQIATFCFYVVTALAFAVYAWCHNLTDHFQNELHKYSTAKIADHETRLTKIEDGLRGKHVELPPPPINNAWSNSQLFEIGKLRIQLDSLESKHADLVDFYRKLNEKMKDVRPQTRTVRPPDLLPAIDPEHVERIPPVFPPLSIPESR